MVPRSMLSRSVPVEDRFWARVLKTETCWLWIGAKHSGRYGAINVSGRQMGAHRFSYEMAHGPIPDGLLICHHCDTPACVNPAHLFLGTAMENNADRDKKGRLGTRGECNPKAKLTNNEADALRKELRDNPRYGAIPPIARRYGVSVSQAGRIKHGRKGGRHHLAS